jgi:hypothetical protein
VVMDSGVSAAMALSFSTACGRRRWWRRADGNEMEDKGETRVCGCDGFFWSRLIPDV